MNKNYPMKKRFFVFSQYLLPHHLLSRAVGCLAETRIPWLKNLLIRAFMRRFQIDLSEARIDTPEGYEDFNAFFTRALKDQARPLSTEEQALLSPCDGQVSQLGDITQGRIFQAKGHHFSLIDLLGGDLQRAEPFMGGSFATLYLSPKDYHRVHMPLAGRLREMIYIPGRLFSVNQTTVESVPSLFARNERVVCIFDTAQGPMAVVLVGAMIVASIETVWAGLVTPPKRTLKRFCYDQPAPHPIQLDKGAELGRFRLGSTVILLFGPEVATWCEGLKPQSPVRMGEALGHAKDV